MTTNLDRMRELLAEQEREFNERGFLIEAIFRGSLDAIVVMGKDGEVREWNETAHIMFGCSREEALGKQVADLMIPEEHREAHYRGLAKYFETGQGKILNKRINLEALRYDGSLFPVELTVVPVEGSDPPNFIGFIRDLTDRPINE